MEGRLYEGRKADYRKEGRKNMKEISEERI
jgi:hypothetical protein